MDFRQVEAVVALEYVPASFSVDHFLLEVQFLEKTLLEVAHEFDKVDSFIVEVAAQSVGKLGDLSKCKDVDLGLPL